MKIRSFFETLKVLWDLDLDTVPTVYNRQVGPDNISSLISMKISLSPCQRARE